MNTIRKGFRSDPDAGVFLCSIFCTIQNEQDPFPVCIYLFFSAPDFYLDLILDQVIFIFQHCLLCGCLQIGLPNHIILVYLIRTGIVQRHIYIILYLLIFQRDLPDCRVLVFRRPRLRAVRLCPACIVFIHSVSPARLFAEGLRISPFRSSVLAHQGYTGDRGLDLVNPAFDVLPVFPLFLLHPADPFDDGLIGPADHLPVQPVLDTRRSRHQFTQQESLIHLVQHMPYLREICFSVMIIIQCPGGQDQKPADQNEGAGIPWVSCEKEVAGEHQHAGDMQEKKKEPILQESAERQRTLFPMQFLFHCPADHIEYPIPLLVLIKSRIPACSSFARIRVILTLRVLSSIKT